MRIEPTKMKVFIPYHIIVETEQDHRRLKDALNACGGGLYNGGTHEAAPDMIHELYAMVKREDEKYDD